MSNRACSEMDALIRRLADCYQRLIDEHASLDQHVEYVNEEMPSSLFQARHRIREHQGICPHCRSRVQGLVAPVQTDRETAA